MQLQLPAVGRGVDAVGVERAGHGLAALLEGVFERTLHQAERVAVDQHLVLGIDRGDRVLHVEDGGDGRFHHDVGDAGRIVLADSMVAVDVDLDVQAVIDQQHGLRIGGVAAEAGELLRGLQADVALGGLGHQRAARNAVAGDVGVVACGQRRGAVEERLGLGDHLVAARLAVALGGITRILRDRVGAIEGVVEAAPAGVGGVERVARIGQRHHELRTADSRDFLIDIGGLDLLRGRFGAQVADLLQERGIGIDVERLALVGTVPVVDLRLQRIANREKLAIPWRHIADDGGDARPEGVGVHAGAGGGFLGDEVVEDRRDLQSMGVDTVHNGMSHENSNGKAVHFQAGKPTNGHARAG